MITSIGRFLRELRIENQEILKDMADNLGVSSAFLSAVENGKKKLPDSWYKKLTNLYFLTQEQQEKLEKAVMESNGVVELNITHSACYQRDLAVSFAREFNSLDEDLCEKLLDLLNKKK